MAEQAVATAAAENMELLRAGYAAFARGDMATLENQTFHPDVVWHAYRLGILGGDHHGWGELMEFFKQTMELTEDTFRVEPEELLANENGVAAVVRSTARRGDRVLDSRQIHQYRVRDGRVVEVWQFVADGAAAEAFWS